MIVDAHCHLGETKRAYPCEIYSPEEHLKRMREESVDKSCCFSFWDLPDNGYISEATKNSDRLIPFALINPTLADAAAELERCFKALGFKGLKLHGHIHGFAMNDHALLDPLFELCEAHSAPIVAHGLADNPFTMPGLFSEMAGRFPKVNLIMAHTGYMWGTPIAIEASEKHKNLYLGTSCIPTMLLRFGIERIGAEKFVFESDSPRWDLHYGLMKIRRAVLEERDWELIAGENMRRLLGIDE